MIDPTIVDGHRCLAVLISERDLRDQCALVGRARWDGSALWLDGQASTNPVQVFTPGRRAVLLKVTPDILDALVDGTEYGPELTPLVKDAEFIAFSYADQLPASGIAIPGALAHAFVPNWKTS